MRLLRACWGIYYYYYLFVILYELHVYIRICVSKTWSSVQHNLLVIESRDPLGKKKPKIIIPNRRWCNDVYTLYRIYWRPTIYIYIIYIKQSLSRQKNHRAFSSRVPTCQPIPYIPTRNTILCIPYVYTPYYSNIYRFVLSS